MDEVSVVYRGGFDPWDVSWDGDFEVCEIETTDNHGDDGHDDVIHERSDDRGESATDDDTDSEVDDGAFVDEFFEFFKDFWFFFGEIFRKFTSFLRYIVFHDELIIT